MHQVCPKLIRNAGQIAHRDAIHSEGLVHVVFAGLDFVKRSCVDDHAWPQAFHGSRDLLVAAQINVLTGEGHELAGL